LPSLNAFREATEARLHDKTSLISRDVELMLEGLKSKTAYLTDLREQTLRHRLEDLTQLTEARKLLWASWDERLKRIEEWMRDIAELKRESASLHAWRQSVQGFERLQEFTDRYAQSLERKAKRFGEDLLTLGVDRGSWDNRLRAQESELRGFIDRQAAKETEIMVSKARKQPYLDFIYHEREEEGRLALRLKSMRTSINHTLERITRAQAWVTEQARANPDVFEPRKDAFLQRVHPFQKQFSDIRERTLELALSFEGGRQRLRWIYEQVQRMRVVQEMPTVRTPLIERLFGSGE
jgi:hypothetical protein